jgi:DNA-binding PadR family transcriptional regulator
MSQAEASAWSFGRPDWMNKGEHRWMMKGDPRRRIEHLERLAALRHLAGTAPFGGGPMWGGGPFGGGRGRRRRGDVRTALLMLLAEEARNGYQLMQTIEERSGGRWRPSPGSVYPALAQLEDEGLVRATERDGAKLFEITDAGREQIGGRTDQAAPWEMNEDPAFETLADLRSLVHQLAMAAGQVVHAGDEDQIRRAREVLNDARRTLYRILAQDEDPRPGTEGGDADTSA